MKRGTSDLSLVVGVIKPSGMSSHDVVNRCRRIFGERRIGHTGTLDPLAEGVLPVCVGPATRLGQYLTAEDKRYVVRIGFGISTYTDDADGEVLKEGSVPHSVTDEQFARRFVESLVGARKQLPPAYSAIKVDGKKSYEAARQGKVIDLTPRDIVVHEARLVGMGMGFRRPSPMFGHKKAVGTPAEPAAVQGDAEGQTGAECRVLAGGKVPSESSNGSEWCDLPWWDVEFHVSKGTYIRSLARDAGIALGCPAHVAALKRTQSGLLSWDMCLTLEALEHEKERAALDPVRLLGLRFAYADGALPERIANGSILRRDDLKLFVRRRANALAEMCACTSGVCESCEPPADGELVSVIVENKLAALYRFDQSRNQWRAQCVFQKGVSRGSCI